MTRRTGRWEAIVVRETDDVVLERDVLAAGPISVPLSWVPVDACTLPTAEQPLRVAEFDALFAAALRGLQRREPGRLQLRLTDDPKVEAGARELIARESSCCSFFDFQLTLDDGELQLDVRVPDARIDVLDGITRQAEAVSAGSVRGSLRAGSPS